MSEEFAKLDLSGHPIWMILSEVSEIFNERVSETNLINSHLIGIMHGVAESLHARNPEDPLVGIIHKHTKQASDRISDLISRMHATKPSQMKSGKSLKSRR